VVESSGLLNRRRPLKSTGGSNPPLSARSTRACLIAQDVRRTVDDRCGQRATLEMVFFAAMGASTYAIQCIAGR
jgi:hypothetical protein